MEQTDFSTASDEELLAKAKKLMKVVEMQELIFSRLKKYRFSESHSFNRYNLLL